MSHALKVARTKFLMTVPQSIPVAVAAADNAGIPKSHIFLLEGELTGYTTMKELLQIGKSVFEKEHVPYYRIPLSLKSHDICGFLNFSSGTTGLPKAVRMAEMAPLLHTLGTDLVPNVLGYDISRKCDCPVLSTQTDGTSRPQEISGPNSALSQ